MFFVNIVANVSGLYLVPTLKRKFNLKKRNIKWKTKLN